MKQTNQLIRNRLKRAVETTAPDVLPHLLTAIEEKGVLKMNTNDSLNTAKKDSTARKRKAKPRRWLMIAAPIAAVLVLVLGSWFGFANYTTDAVVAFDVNPSIELSVNRAEKILKVNSRNSEAHEIIGDMDLKGVNLDVAVNALIGSMVQKGYISDLNNSILITVNSKDAEKGEQLQKRLAANVDSLLKGLSIDGAILSQTAAADDDTNELADRFAISPGKAAIVKLLLEEDPSLEYEDVAVLSINDLKILIEGREVGMSKVRSSGEASKKGYLGADQAKEIAFSHAEVSESEVTGLKIELDSDDGEMVYEIDFYVKGFEYEYEIHAKNGRILDFDIDDDFDNDENDKKTEGKKPSSKVSKPSSDEYISRAAAENIAFKHANVSRDQVRELEIDFENDDGKRYFEIEFEVGRTEYEYEIDAISGKILDFDIDKDNDDDNRTHNANQSTSKETARNTTKAKAQESTKATAKATEKETAKSTGKESGKATTKETEKTPAATEAKTEARLSAKSARSMVLNKFGGIIEKIEYNYDGKNPLYKGEAVKKGSRVVFELNARTYSFKKWDVGNDNDWDKWANTISRMISMDEAARKVISKSGQNYTFIQKIEFNWDDEKPLYQGEAFYRGYKISFEINALSGSFHKWDVDGGDETWTEKYHNVR